MDTERLINLVKDQKVIYDLSNKHYKNVQMKMMNWINIAAELNQTRYTSTMSFSLGFIGGGNMSTAIVKGILKTETISPSKIWVSGPHLHNLKHWSELGTNVTIENGEVFSKCDVIFLGVKPSMLGQAVKECLNTLPSQGSTKKVLFVSMLAGITIDELKKALNEIPVEVSVVRIMPNTPMTVGEGACLYTPDNNVSPENCALLEKLMSGCGICEKIPESLMDSLGSLIGCGPAFIYIIIEALADGAVKQGAPRDQALRFASQMVAGSGKMVLKSGKHPGLLKDEVCSPGGSTICGVAVLEEGKIRSSLINAMEASISRSKQLGKK